MTVTYKKLWHILIDRNMKKKDLQEQAGMLRKRHDWESSLTVYRLRPHLR